MWRTRFLPSYVQSQGDAIMTRPARAGKAGAPAHPAREHSMLRQNAASHRQNQRVAAHGRAFLGNVMMRFGQGGKKDEADDEPARSVCARRWAAGRSSWSGMPGCGKSAVGRRLAPRLGMPFVDADEEIERAAGKPITDIFKDHGEPYFRDGERRVIARLLAAGPAGAGDRRRRVHGGRDAREHPPLRHLGLAEGGAAAADAARAQEEQSPAADE